MPETNPPSNNPTHQQDLSATYKDGILRVFNTQGGIRNQIGEYSIADDFATDLTRITLDDKTRADLIRHVCFLQGVESLGKGVLMRLEQEALEILQALGEKRVAEMVLS